MWTFSKLYMLNNSILCNKTLFCHISWTMRLSSLLPPLWLKFFIYRWILDLVLQVNFFLLRRLLGVRTKGSERQGKVSKLAKGEMLMLNIGSMSTGARVVAVKNDLAKLQLTSPVCTSKGEKIALSRRVEKHWRLIGWGQIQAGITLDVPPAPQLSWTLIRDRSQETPAAIKTWDEFRCGKGDKCWEPFLWGGEENVLIVVYFCFHIVIGLFSPLYLLLKLYPILWLSSGWERESQPVLVSFHGIFTDIQKLVRHLIPWSISLWNYIISKQWLKILDSGKHISCNWLYLLCGVWSSEGNFWAP